MTQYRQSLFPFWADGVIAPNATNGGFVRLVDLGGSWAGEQARPKASDDRSEPELSATRARVYSRKRTTYVCYMGREDWYRNEEWNSEIENRFLERIDRSRGQRDQQLKIQIQTLAERSPSDALRLVETYNDTRTDDVWDLEVIAASAKAFEKLGKSKKALDAYRNILQHDESQPFFPTYVLLDAPFLIARKGEISEFPFAFDLLLRAENSLSKQGLNFAVQRFLYHACHALIRRRSGQKEQAKEHAVAALREAGVRDSGLRYHRKVGLVGDEHQTTVLALKSITSGYPEWLLGLMAKVG